MSSGLLDTRVWIAEEMGRSVALELLPDRIYVSVVTVAELHAGVLAAHSTLEKSHRMATAHRLAPVLTQDGDFDVLSEMGILDVIRV